MSEDGNAAGPMDAAAAQAKQEVDEHLSDWSARDVADWWGRWYLKAGHKRLGRVLVAVSKAPRSAGSAP